MRTQSIIRSASAVIVIAAASPAMSEDRNYQLPSFERVDVSMGIKAIIEISDNQTVRADAKNSSQLDHLIVEVKNDELEISMDRSFWDFIVEGGLVGNMFRKHNDTVVHINMPTFTAVKARSGADVIVNNATGEDFEGSASSGANLTLNDLAYHSIEVKASSGGDLDANGTCIDLRARVSSGADMDITRLECKSVSVRASSGGDADLFASDSVDARASSGGDITVHGNPDEVERKTSSGGNISVRN